MTRTRAVLLAAASLAIAACGGDSGTTPTPSGNNSMSATIDGTGFTAPSIGVQAAYASSQGLLSIGGTSTTNPVRQINITVVGVTEPGTYNLNPSSVTSGNQALVTIVNGTAASVWTTALSPATGSITIATLTDSRATGTFQFTGQASPGTPATGQVSVTSGSFDVHF